MLKKFFDFNRLHNLIVPETRFIIAASGGIDSMVLLDLCYKAGFEFAVAHCNFKLRNQESDDDAAFVREIANNLGFGYFEKDFNTKAYAEKYQLGIQESARILRYEWFEQLLQTEKYQFYALAHHFDDKIETFFINLFRGTGISGLRSIQPINAHCIRPLLFATRNEIHEYASKNQIKFREDSSNLQDYYTRNRIRHFVIPTIENAYPDFRKGFENTFYALTLTEAFLKTETAKINRELVEINNGKTYINIRKLREQHCTELCLFEILRQYGFNSSTIRDIFRSIDGISGKKFYSKLFSLVRERENFVITRFEHHSNGMTNGPVVIHSHQTHIVEPVELHFETVAISPEFVIEKKEKLAFLDFDKLIFPLTIRQPVKGDAFVPLGMQGVKKLSDFFIDEKFTNEQKNNVFVLLSGNEIVWVIGYRISDRYKVTSNTKTVFIIIIQT